jgi:hypothetical protein
MRGRHRQPHRQCRAFLHTDQACTATNIGETRETMTASGAALIGL